MSEAFGFTSQSDVQRVVNAVRLMEGAAADMSPGGTRSVRYPGESVPVYNDHFTAVPAAEGAAGIIGEWDTANARFNMVAPTMAMQDGAAVVAASIEEYALGRAYLPGPHRRYSLCAGDYAGTSVGDRLTTTKNVWTWQVHPMGRFLVVAKLTDPLVSCLYDAAYPGHPVNVYGPTVTRGSALALDAWNVGGGYMEFSRPGTQFLTGVAIAAADITYLSVGKAYLAGSRDGLYTLRAADYAGISVGDRLTTGTASWTWHAHALGDYVLMAKLTDPLVLCSYDPIQLPRVYVAVTDEDPATNTITGWWVNRYGAGAGPVETFVVLP